MKLPPGFDLGAATHTGRMRSANEDDYLVLAPPPPLERPFALVCALADGMGGVLGGAEASRAALRGFGSSLLDGDGDGAVEGGEHASEAPAERLAAAFAAASRRVREHAEAVPSLRDMGTTLTALAFANDGALVAHVGDTRAYRLRGGLLQQVTNDHAVREPDNYLTRCIGAGQDDGPPELHSSDVLPGDRWLLASDGIWGTVGKGVLAAVLLDLPPQAAAERLVEAALAAGGPDNATAVVVHVTPPGERPREVELPREEHRTPRRQGGRQPSLRAPRWPWLLLALAALLLAAAALHAWYGVDVLGLLRAVLPG